MGRVIGKRGRTCANAIRTVVRAAAVARRRRGRRRLRRLTAPRPGTCSKSGRSVKPHGLRGDVVVASGHQPPRAGRARSGARHDEAGRCRSCTSRPHQARWIVHFDGVDDPRGCRGAARPRARGRAASTIPTSCGCTSWSGRPRVDAAGTALGLGRGAGQANPASDLLVLDGGALCPLVFVVGPATTDGSSIDPPDGLFELTSDGLTCGSTSSRSSRRWSTGSSATA